MTENLDKLPKWARMEIERLRRDLEYNKEKLRLAYSKDGSRIKICGFSDPDIPIGDRETIQFQTDRGRIDVSLRRDRDDKDFQIYVSSCNGPISIIPNASNCVYIEVSKP